MALKGIIPLAELRFSGLFYSYLEINVFKPSILEMWV